MNAVPNTDAFTELSERGLVALSTDADALRDLLGSGPVTFYCGFDPTAPSLHIGNLVQLLVMRRLQLAGHHPLALVGGATGLIGDPRMSGERVLNSRDVVDGWVERIRSQVQRFLDFDGENPARMVNNLDWTAPMSAIDFLRDVGKHFRVNKMLTKDSVAARLNSEAGISFTEFSYQLLQGMDFHQLYRTYGCVLQTGGSDQWGNLTAGTDLVHRAEGVSVHAIATPLITKADGSKFGKTEGGAVWLDPELTSPFAFYQFWLNAEDAKVGDYLRVFTFLPLEEVARLEEATTSNPAAREGQRTLATVVTELVHGADALARVRQASEALFGRGDVHALDAATLGDALAELPTAKVEPGQHRLVQLLVGAGLAKSLSDGQRAIKGGGISVNNEKVGDPDAVLGADALLHNRWILLRHGKRSLGAVDVG